MSETATSRSILLIGATGRTGIQIIRAKSKHSSSGDIQLHAFVRDPSKLTESDKEQCTSVQQGDASAAEDIKAAIEETQCDTIIVAVGHPKLGKEVNVVREKTAKAIVEGIGDRQSEISVLLLSAVGAGDSQIKMGFGLGALVYFYLRHAMADQTKQEEIFQKAYANNKEQLLILRPPELIDNKPKGKVITMEHDKLPNFKIDRQDLGEWMLNAAYNHTDFGKELCITTGV